MPRRRDTIEVITDPRGVDDDALAATRSCYALVSFFPDEPDQAFVDRPGEYWARTVHDEVVHVGWRPEPQNRALPSLLVAEIGRFPPGLAEPRLSIALRLWHEEVFAPVPLPMPA